LFEYEFIAKIDRKHFLPWRAMPTNSPKVGKILLTDFDYMYLVRIVPRKNLFQYCTPNHLPALWFYVKQHLSSRKKQVIPTLE
jgi:dimethyladenosine transferase 2